jgi:hypothetical protein
VPIVNLVIVSLLAASPFALPARWQEPRSSRRESVTVSGTVERVERSTRTLTVRTGSNTTQTITVAPEVKLFDELRTGDRITVRLIESVIVGMHPGAKPSPPVDTTATAASRDPSGASEVLQQVKAAVTIERVDRTRNVIVYKTADNQHVTRAVVDPHLLDGVKAGDVLEITYTRERAVDLQRAR